MLLSQQWRLVSFSSKAVLLLIEPIRFLSSFSHLLKLIYRYHLIHKHRVAFSHLIIKSRVINALFQREPIGLWTESSIKLNNFSGGQTYEWYHSKTIIVFSCLSSDIFSSRDRITCSVVHYSLLTIQNKNNNFALLYQFAFVLSENVYKK